MQSPVLETAPLGFPWVTVDPFLFCVHHDDAYPAGNEKMGPAASLEGRNLGQDFELKDGFRMYHGHVVPGFPAHPHRGFETVTIARRGYIDHSDSLGAAARFGKGDVQWLTAGGGIVHSEMFPLIEKSQPNPVELFQIWLNLPRDDKLVAPHFSMLWSQEIPRIVRRDAAGRTAEITIVAGALDERAAPSPPPHSWAKRSDSDVAIWSIVAQAGASFSLPPAARSDTVRTLYFFRGSSLSIGGEMQREHAAIVVASDRELELVAGDAETEILMLQGRPIGEPIVQYGPFVMNSREEIELAISDYRRTRYGGWPWPADDPVHDRERGRFARHADGRVETM
jgi:redox-sensitive bicupin YhaK (pirin superfamily)